MLLTLASMVLAASTGCGTGGDAGSGKAQPVAEAGLRAQLELDSAVVEPGEAVSIRVSVQNHASQPLPFLPVNTALESPLKADAFEVLLDGEAQPYLGILAQRLPITADDVVMLAPGERLERSLDLAQHYRMDRAGQYQVRYTPRPPVLGADVDVEPAEVVTDPAALSVTRR